MGREPELDWLRKNLMASHVAGRSIRHLHLHGPKGIGVSTLLHAFLENLGARADPTVVWQFSGMFRFTPLPDCIRGMVAQPRWIGLEPSPWYAEVEGSLLAALDERRRQILSDGGLILYRSGGDYKAAGDRPRMRDGAGFRRRMAAEVSKLWLAACEGGCARGILLVILEHWNSNPPQFRDWMVNELAGELLFSSLPWPLVLLTTGRDALVPGRAGARPVIADDFSQMEVRPLSRPDFFKILQEQNLSREAWDWLFAECEGIPGRLSLAWERWNRHQSVRLEAHDELEALLPPGFRRPLSARERLWIQVAAAFPNCDEEALALIVGRREATHAAAYLSAAAAVRVVKGAFFLDSVLKGQVTDWMREHHPALLGECLRGVALLESLNQLVPQREDRGYLSTLVALRQFDSTLLEAVFPD